MIKILHKLRLKLAKESLARARRRVKTALKADAYALICRDRFRQGEHGYLNDKRTYD